MTRPAQQRLFLALQPPETSCKYWVSLALAAILGGACAGAAEPLAPSLFEPPRAAPSSSADIQFELQPVSQPPPASPRLSLLGRLGSDQRNFYDRETLTWVLTGVGIHAAISNTNIDEFLREEYQQNVRNADTDEWSELFHSSKFFGEGVYVLPIYAAAALSAMPFDEDTMIGTAGEWGGRSLRTILVGAPPLLALQIGIGASRPMEEHSFSHWEPFQDDNGASGHAFMGAVPFLSAARMTEHRGMKAVLYAGSVMPGISRINDDAHYTSQVILGWTLAYLASGAVDDTYASEDAPRLLPGPVADGNGVNVLWRY